jgi:hypothetical protein
MSSTFQPVENLQIFCRFCDKTSNVNLDRSIAANGRTVDRTSTFEYLCPKCFKTVCFSGNDLLEQKKPDAEDASPRDYLPKEHYFIGETILHKKWNERGLIIGKDHGTPNRIHVNFEKSGLKKLIEGLK